MSATAKTAKAPRKARAQPPGVSAEQRRQMIEEFAYFRAEERNFADGDAVTDWLASEQEVDELLSRKTH